MVKADPAASASGGLGDAPVSACCTSWSFFLMKKTGDAMGDFDGWILPVWRFSWRNASSSTYSLGDSG